MYMTSITLFGLSSFVNNNYLFSLSIGLIFVTTGLVIAAKLRKEKKLSKTKKYFTLYFCSVFCFLSALTPVIFTYLSKQLIVLIIITLNLTCVIGLALNFHKRKIYG